MTDGIMTSGTIRWYGFKLPVPFSWGTREQQAYKKSHLNHGYSTKEKQSAAPLKTIGKTQYYQTVSSYTERPCRQSSVSGRILSREEASFLMMKGKLEQRKWTLFPNFCELAPPLPEIKVGESQFSLEAAKFSRAAAAAGPWGISENDWEMPPTLWQGTSSLQSTCQVLLLFMPGVREPVQRLGSVQLKWLFKDQHEGKQKMWAVINFSRVTFNFLFAGLRSHTDDPLSLSTSPHMMGSWNWVFSGQAAMFLFHSLCPQSAEPWSPLHPVLYLRSQPLTTLL